MKDYATSRDPVSTGREVGVNMVANGLNIACATAGAGARA